MNHLRQKFVGSKDHNRSALNGFSILHCESASPTFLHGLSGRTMLNLVRHTNLCIHNSESYMFHELFLLRCLLIFIYQLIVKRMCAFVHRCLLLLWSVKSFYSRMTRRNKLQYLVHFQDWVKAVVLRRSNTNPVFVLFYPEVLPSLCQESHRNYTSSYEFLVQ